MPKSKYTNHKGRSRRFTSHEELEAQRKKDEARKKRGEEAVSSSEEEDEEETGNKGSSSGSESESDSEPGKPKGVENLIEVENPNRVQKKTKKLSTLNESLKEGGGKPELSRREREELEKQRATAHYFKLHAEGKTEEARADLARLAIIKQQREEAAKRREKEKQEKEAAKQAKTAQTQKALGKKA